MSILLCISLYSVSIYVFNNILLLSIPNTNGINLVLIEHALDLSLLRICSVMSAVASSVKCSEYTLCLDTINNTKRLKSEFVNWNFILVQLGEKNTHPFVLVSRLALVIKRKLTYVSIFV